MSRFDGQRISDLPLRRLPSIRNDITSILLENSHLSSSIFKKNDETIEYLRVFTNHLIVHYTSISKCIKYLKRARSYERVIIIAVINHDKETGITTADVSRLYQYRQIQMILIVSVISQKDDDIVIHLLIHTGDNVTKEIEVFHDYQLLIGRLQRLMDENEDFDDGLFAVFNQREKALRDVRDDLGAFVWSQSYRVILKAMPHNSFEAKEEMLAECRAYYRGNHHELAVIDEFEHTYRSNDAIQWYTKPCFLFRLVNKALRTEDIRALYTFRYFIVDLSTCLEEAAIRSSHCSTTFRVYRGSKFSRDEVEQLQVGTLVAANGFLSSSRDLNVAQEFIGIDPITGISPSRSREDKRQYVLFEIDVDLIHSPDTIAVDVSSQSAMPHENEVIFNFGTTFIITRTTYDVEHYLWHIQINSSSEVAQLNRDYNMFVRRRLNDVNAILMCGHFLTEIYSDYGEAASYFHHLLRSKTIDDKDRSNIFYHLGRAYRLMGKHQQAKTYFEYAQLFQRRKLPQSSFDYGRTLSGLSTVYSEMGDSKRALHLEEKAIAIHRSCLPDDHVEMAFHSNRLAYFCWQERHYERALALLNNTLLFFKEKMPADYPAEAQSLHIMGLVQHSLGNREQALHSFKEALRMRESLLPDDHPSVAWTYYELSVLYAERDGEYTMALDYAQRALNIRQKKLSPNHIAVKQSIELFERLSQRNNITSS